MAGVLDPLPEFLESSFLEGASFPVLDLPSSFPEDPLLLSSLLAGALSYFLPELSFFESESSGLLAVVLLFLSSEVFLELSLSLALPPLVRTPPFLSSSLSFLLSSFLLDEAYVVDPPDLESVVLPLLADVRAPPEDLASESFWMRLLRVANPLWLSCGRPMVSASIELTPSRANNTTAAVFPRMYLLVGEKYIICIPLSEFK